MGIYFPRSSLRLRLGRSSMTAKAESREGEVKSLSARNDQYGGVIVAINGGDELMDPDTFLSSLTFSIAHWKLQCRERRVFGSNCLQRVNLVAAAVKLQKGFWYHHAEPNYLMLLYWIPQSAHTPANAMHRVVIGAFLINRNREVLVVQEKGGQYRGTGVWKLPTGVVDEGEYIFAAAVREVKEETGIDSEFVEVQAFRKSHKSFFEKSDLFFVCMLRPDVEQMAEWIEEELERRMEK